MRMVLTATLAASLLGGTAVMAQPSDKNRDRGNQGEQTDRKAQKVEDKKEKRAAAPGQAVGAPRVLSAPQPAVQQRAVNTRPQGRQDRSAPSARKDQPTAAPIVPAASGQPMRKVAPYALGQTDRMRAQQPAPVAPYQSPQYQTRNPTTTGGRDNQAQGTRWSRGDRLPDQYRQNRYYVNDWQQYALRQPPSGYRWVRNDSNDFYLSMIATGIIADVIYRSDRDDRWRQRYARSYSYNDDVYYQQCRRSPDPAGVILGGLIGGLLGNAAGRGNTGSTIAGVIFGGAVGAALTSNMDCEDRSYAYKTYYNGFNSGRPGSYQWRNPRNDHRGDFRIGSYYSDPYGFRCARFDQVTYIRGRSYRANGVACRQPDGSWAVVK